MQLPHDQMIREHMTSVVAHFWQKALFCYLSEYHAEDRNEVVAEFVKIFETLE